MKNNSFIITLTGPSQSGKSLVMKKIEQLGTELSTDGIFFEPKRIKKFTTRHLRFDELKVEESGEKADVEYVKRIPESCDLVYQTYGVRYGIETDVLKRELQAGHSPVVVINDIRVVEEIKKYFSGKVLSLFLFRKIPQLEDFKKEASNRGNISEPEIVARYEKAIAIYRVYIENIILFDKVVLNSVEYLGGEEKSRNTILDMQLRNVLLPVIRREKALRTKMEYPKSSRIFVIAGNAASGKDEIIRALLSMGKLQAKVLPKYATRKQEPADGKEIICKYIPSRRYLELLKKEYQAVRTDIMRNLVKMDDSFKTTYREEFITFEQKLEEKNKDEYARFWDIVTSKLNDKSNEINIENEYFERNPQYEDLEEIKKNSKKIYEDHDTAIYSKENKLFLIYGSDNRLYGCDITHVKEYLSESKFHLVIVASQISVVNALKYLYGEKNVRLIYAHSEITVNEFEENASDLMKKEKMDDFRKILDDYTKGISDYDHVTIYAKSQLTYEQTSKEEELIDQMFRLLRAY